MMIVLVGNSLTRGGEREGGDLMLERRGWSRGVLSVFRDEKREERRSLTVVVRGKATNCGEKGEKKENG